MSGPSIHPERIRRNHPRDYAVRFVFGGAVTAATGLVAAHWGPMVGGLFLAFPAILPASLTLVERHDGKDRAGADAAGAVAGALGLGAFAAVVWGTARTVPAWAVLALASAAWLVASVTAWAVLRSAGLLRDADGAEEEDPHRAPAETSPLAEPSPRSAGGG